MIPVAKLPLWITPMQAVAWIASRSAAMTMRASLVKRESDEGSAALNDTSGWCGSSPGLTFHNLNLWAGLNEVHDPASVGQRSLIDLVDALRRGAVIAWAEPYETSNDQRGRRQPLLASDWAALNVTDDPPETRMLVLKRVLSGIWSGEVLALHWADLLIETATLIKHFPTNDISPSATTALAVNRLTRRLVQLMKDQPVPNAPKAVIQRQMKAEGHNVSDRAFTSAYQHAVQQSGATRYSNPGRKSKRRIDTPD